jgi:hypothetical protein
MTWLKLKVKDNTYSRKAPSLRLTSEEYEAGWEQIPNNSSYDSLAS